MFKPECLRNEDMFVDSLNNSKVSELSQNLHYMIVHMFDHVKEDDLILCSHVPGFQKPDIKITINNVTKYVSLKYGNATFVHQEQFKTLIPFLLEAGVQKITAILFCVIAMLMVQKMGQDAKIIILQK